MNNVVLKYATAQPLCRIDQKVRTDWFFIQNYGIAPELCFDAASIKTIESNSGKIIKANNHYTITGLVPGISSYVKIINTEGAEQRIIILSYEESDHLWLFNLKGNKQLFISDANLYLNTNQLHVYGQENVMKVIQLNENSMLNVAEVSKPVGDYKQYEFTVPSKTVTPEITHLAILSGSERIRASVKSVDASNQLFNKIFIKRVQP